MHQHRPWHLQADARHGVAKALTVLCLVDGIPRRADHLHAEGRQHTLSIQIQRAIQCRLTTHGGQQRLGALFFDDLRQRPPIHRLDIGGVRHSRIGHDGCRVGVRQHHPVAFFAQRLAGLGTGVVELARLSDDDGAGTDDEDAVDVVASGHLYAGTRCCTFCPISSMK